ncbi:hypothetical protein Salat_2615900 [Sesamum alatum]|uniref:Uncharacterized protein n=1 Tax=Sesamum alatum TaxID=300844 RepID=A0AAE1XNG3_9LAMI|nr:hypothetical protein Salat_2615900 [Sesamum alatum]
MQGSTVLRFTRIFAGPGRVSSYRPLRSRLRVTRVSIKSSPHVPQWLGTMDLDSSRLRQALNFGDEGVRDLLIPDGLWNSEQRCETRYADTTRRTRVTIRRLARGSEPHEPGHAGLRSFQHGTSTGPSHGPFARHPPSSRGRLSLENLGLWSREECQTIISMRDPEVCHWQTQVGQDTTSAIHSNPRGTTGFAGSDTGKGPLAIGKSHRKFGLQMS